MALNNYLTQVRRLLHDPNGAYFSTSDLTDYINTARSQIALEGQCVRVLISGQVSVIAVTNGGSGYAASTVLTVSGSGMGATATPTIVAGVITAVTVNAGGSGYDLAANTTVTATDPTGAGHNATFSVTLIGANLTVIGQEQYTFASRAAAAAALNSGVRTPLGVFSVAVSWGSMKPMLSHKIFTEFQAYYRSYSLGLQNYPTIWSDYGQGDQGSIFTWPLASAVSSMDWDTWCDVIPLVSDSTVEAIPYSWTDAVKYYAAHLAFYNAQRMSDADREFETYSRTMKRARALSTPPFWPDPYME